MSEEHVGNESSVIQLDSPLHENSHLQWLLLVKLVSHAISSVGSERGKEVFIEVYTLCFMCKISYSCRVVGEHTPNW